MTPILKRNTPFILLLFSCGLFFITYMLFDIRFKENDDVVMALISSGSYSGEPDAHLVFINIIYGYFIKTLYSILPLVEWYTLAFVIINILSVTAIATAILKSKNKLVVKLIFLIFLYSIFINFTIHLQFTKTAAIAAIAGVILIYCGEKKSKYLGAFFFILATLIRFKAGFLVLLISFPIFLKGGFNLRKNFSEINNKILIFAILIAFVGKTIDFIYYNKNSEWKQYKEYNLIRGQINDNPNARSVENDLPDEISSSDYELLLNFFPNPSVVDLSLIQSIHLRIGEVQFSSKLYNLIRFIKLYGLWLLLLFIISLLFLYNYKKKINRIPLLMFLILFVALSFVSLSGTIKYRVFISALATFILFLPFISSKNTYSNSYKIIVAIVFIMSVIYNLRSYSIVKTNKIDYNYYQSQTNIISSYLKNQNKTLIPFKGSYRMEYNNPFDLSASFKNNQIYFAGWLTHIPFNNKHFDSFDIFINGNGLFVSKIEYKKATSLIANSILINNQVEVIPKIILQTEKDLIVEFIQQ